MDGNGNWLILPNSFEKCTYYMGRSCKICLVQFKGILPTKKKNRKIWPCLGFLNVFQNLLSSPGEASKKLWSFFYLNLIIWHPKHILSHCERSQKDIFHALYQKYPSAIRAACAISEISIHNESGLCYFTKIFHCERKACFISEITINYESGLCYLINIHPLWDEQQ